MTRKPLRISIRTSAKAAMVLVILSLSWLQMQLSCLYYSPAELADIAFGYALLNIATNWALLALLLIVVNSLWAACSIFCAFTFLLSAVNHYTIQLHDAPLTIAELGNWRTAVNVLGGYRLDLRGLLPMLAILAVQTLLICAIRRLTKKREKNLKRRLLMDAALGLSSAAILYFGYFSPHALLSESVEWRWVDSYQKYGYIACTIRTAQDAANKIKKPDGYEAGCLDNLEIVQKAQPSQDPPDIILILNETFYDLSVLIDLKTDVPYLEHISSLENAIRGYGLNPAGGTNSAEYELLTSNSMKLVEYSPFNFLNLQEANSVVSHMERLGYTTTGAHCAWPLNYNRGSAYSALGFDHIYFADDFAEKSYYGSRTQVTDACCYENLLNWYGSGSGPQFLYLLTIQNHGDWDSNESELDSVHVLGDYGEDTERINEYLSCIRLTDQAFQDFTDRLKEIDRRVIVCMVGDHGPSFKSQLRESSSDEAYLLHVSTPFVIWANYPLEDTAHLDGQSISMNYLVPSLLQLAGVRLSPYYQYMLDMKEEIPILTPWVTYFDQSGTGHAYSETCEYSEMVNTYLWMEYLNLQQNRRQSLFDPYPAATE